MLLPFDVLPWGVSTHCAATYSSAPLTPVTKRYTPLRLLKSLHPLCYLPCGLCFGFAVTCQSHSLLRLKCPAMGDGVTIPPEDLSAEILRYTLCMSNSCWKWLLCRRTSSCVLLGVSGRLHQRVAQLSTAYLIYLFAEVGLCCDLYAHGERTRFIDLFIFFATY